jgi:hypothetical protein
MVAHEAHPMVHHLVAPAATLEAPPVLQTGWRAAPAAHTVPQVSRVKLAILLTQSHFKLISSFLQDDENNVPDTRELLSHILCFQKP